MRLKFSSSYFAFNSDPRSSSFHQPWCSLEVCNVWGGGGHGTKRGPSRGTFRQCVEQGAVSAGRGCKWGKRQCTYSDTQFGGAGQGIPGTRGEKGGRGVPMCEYPGALPSFPPGKKTGGNTDCAPITCHKGEAAPAQGATRGEECNVDIVHWRRVAPDFMAGAHHRRSEPSVVLYNVPGNFLCCVLIRCILWK